VVDAEVSRILRQQEERAIELLSRHRGGLEAVARGLLERETLDGEEVGRLVEEAYGRPVHESDTVRHLPSAAERGRQPDADGRSVTRPGNPPGVAQSGGQGPSGESQAGEGPVNPPE
jgi:hypothetical protein